MSSWSFEGTLLDDLGIVTLVSDSFKTLKRRGGNMLIPQRDGRIFTRKYYEQRTMTLGLEITEDSLTALETAIDTVKALFGESELGTLSETLEDLTVRTLEVEQTGDLDPTRVSPLCVKMLLEFVAPDPFFRGSALVTDTHTIDASPKTYTLTNPGTVYERNPKITLTGPLNNVTITNLINGVSISYNAAIASPRVVTIQSTNGEFTATDDLGTNVIGNVSHAGDSTLFVLKKGANPLSVVDSVATTGTIKIEYYPPYL